jgi:DNA polymerase
MKQKKSKIVKQIKEELINFKESPLFKYRLENNYLPVLSEGNLFAKIIFIGEAPGKQEAEQGRPFVGSAGKILDEVLEKVELDREEIYITNLVNDRPPENRTPTKEEIELYSPFLMRQIQIIKPKIIVTLGRIPTDFILKEYNLEQEFNSMARIHGNIFSVNSLYGKIFIIPTYHPAAVLYNPSLKAILKKDMIMVRNKFHNLK